MDTVYALSSGPVPAGVAVVRISGPLAGAALTAMAGCLPQPRVAALRSLRRVSDNSLLDQALVLWFAGPKSETGEDMAELHLHGSRAVIAAVFRELSELGLRMAEPGEFARRAFANGKLDLTEVEGLADLIAAETENQRVQALGQARGDLLRKAEDWRTRLIDLRAEVEARLDFSDEGDVTEELPREFSRNLLTLKEDLQAALATAGAGQRVREGFRVAILGRPNAGKSSLLNALARRDVAIVTAEAGTTRDVVEMPLDINGYAVVIQDTAGIRETASLAEGEGVRRAGIAAASADLVIWLADCREQDDRKPSPGGTAPIWRIRSKIDLCSGQGDGLGISVLTGAGLAELERRLGELVAGASGRETALVTRERQRLAILDAISALEECRMATDEVLADLLRQAGEGIARLTGRIEVEDVLDQLFSAFCIGK